MKENQLDKCKVYTPEDIAQFMINKLEINFSKKFKLLEPAVGSGNIILLVIKDYLEFARKNEIDEKTALQTIRESFVAFDIDYDAIKEFNRNLKKLISDFYISYKGNIDIVYHLDLLNYENEELEIFNNVTHVICNPPYIYFRNLDKNYQMRLKKFEVCSTGLPNLYFAFIEFIVNKINPHRSVFITPSSYLKAKNATKLRKFLVKKRMLKAIYDFRDYIFDAQVLVCVSVFERSEQFSYYRSDKNYNLDLMFNTKKVNPDNLTTVENTLNDDYIKIGDLFNVEGSIATIDDNFFIIKDSEIKSKNSKYYYIEKPGKLSETLKTYKIEKKLVKRLYISNSGLRKNNNKRYIIFPYSQGKQIHIDKLKNKYSGYYDYYKSGKKKDPDSPYFGRNQNIKNSLKPRFVIPKLLKDFNMEHTSNRVVNSGISILIKDAYRDRLDEIVEHMLTNEKIIENYLKTESVQSDENYFSMSTRVINDTPIIRRSDFNEGD